jgi:hypothetical protein
MNLDVGSVGDDVQKYARWCRAQCNKDSNCGRLKTVARPSVTDGTDPSALSCVSTKDEKTLKIEKIFTKRNPI